jgi:hypothetical protein
MGAFGILSAALLPRLRPRLLSSASRRFMLERGRYAMTMWGAPLSLTPQARSAAELPAAVSINQK